MAHVTRRDILFGLCAVGLAGCSSAGIVSPSKRQVLAAPACPQSITREPLCGFNYHYYQTITDNAGDSLVQGWNGSSFVSDQQTASGGSAISNGSMTAPSGGGSTFSFSRQIPSYSSTTLTGTSTIPSSLSLNESYSFGITGNSTVQTNDTTASGTLTLTNWPTIYFAIVADGSTVELTVSDSLGNSATRSASYPSDPESYNRHPLSVSCDSLYDAIKLEAAISQMYTVLWANAQEYNLYYFILWVAAGWACLLDFLWWLALGCE